MKRALAQRLTCRRAARMLERMRLAVSALALATLVAAGAPSHAGRAARKKPPPPAAELVALNTHETFTLRPDGSGHFGKKELRGWSRFLRCHHTGRTHVMSSRLADLMYQTAQHFDWKRLLVVAGYRAPRIAKKKGNPKSPHKQGLACDFRIEGVANTELRDYLRNAFQRVGVGYYPNSDFVHLDVRKGKASAFWIDYSGPGERAKYSKHPQADLDQMEPGSTESEPESEMAAEGPEPTPPVLPPVPGVDEPQKDERPRALAPNAPAIIPQSP
jgi:uncharacterized protein YcbK (DUF882 family)